MLIVKIYIDKGDKKYPLIGMTLPVDFPDDQLDEILGGKEQCEREEFLTCKGVLISLLRQGVSIHSMRDWERRRRDFRQQAASIINNDPTYAAELLKDADKPQFKHEEVEAVFNELEFAISMLNPNAYLVLAAQKTGNKLKKSLIGNVGYGHSDPATATISAIPSSAFSEPYQTPRTGSIRYTDESVSVPTDFHYINPNSETMPVAAEIPAPMEEASASLQSSIQILTSVAHSMGASHATADDGNF